MMTAVALTTRHVTVSLLMRLLRTMFEMNCTEANAASRLCAANANDTKFKVLPRMKQDIPPAHIRLPGYAHHCCGYLQEVGRGELVASAFATWGEKHTYSGSARHAPNWASPPSVL
jgi:hypothetical protein